jgi:general secretion pathway protein K
MRIRKILCNEKGIALLITIMIVSLLIVMTVQFGRSMRRELVASINVKDSGLIEALTRSGVNIAMETLAEKDSTSKADTLYDAWGKLSGRDLSSLFEQGALHLTVADLAGRLQVNSLVPAQGGDAASAQMLREILKRLLLSQKFGAIDEKQAQEIIDSLVDWIDADDLESEFGAEDSYYRSLEHPYACKNGPVSSLEELLLVKGMTPEILYGTQEHAGLAGYLTVYGDDGKININTVDPVLLQAMAPQMTEEVAKSIVDYREQEDNKEKLSSINWYRDVPFLPGDLTLSANIITVKSSYFMITAQGQFNSLTQQRVAIVHRGPDNEVAQVYGKVD